jgi:hypothetical protein
VASLLWPFEQESLNDRSYCTSLIKASKAYFKLLQGSWIMYVDDQYYQPLPRGTVLSSAFRVGIVGYLNGHQVILNKSKRFGRPVASPPEEFQGEAVKIIRSPQSTQDSVRIEQNAWNLIQAGAPWTLLDNCQDFVSRCSDGKPGSETRNLAVAWAS